VDSNDDAVLKLYETLILQLYLAPEGSVKPRNWYQLVFERYCPLAELCSAPPLHACYNVVGTNEVHL